MRNTCCVLTALKHFYDPFNEATVSYYIFKYLKLFEGYNGCSGSRLPQSKGIIARVVPISQQGECAESIQHASDDILLILSRRPQARELNKCLKKIPNDKR